MRTSDSPMTLTLAVLGIIPFAFATYLSWVHQTFFEKSGLYLFASYSAIILSFLAGTLWGQLIHKDNTLFSKSLLIGSNIITLGAWCSLLLDASTLSISLLFLGFISIFWLEARALKLVKETPTSYINMRFSITAVVCILHLLVLYPHY